MYRHMAAAPNSPRMSSRLKVLLLPTIDGPCSGSLCCSLFMDTIVKSIANPERVATICMAVCQWFP